MHTLTGDVGGRTSKFSFKLETYSEMESPKLSIRMHGFDTFEEVDSFNRLLDIFKMVDIREQDKTVYYWLLCHAAQSKGGTPNASMLEMVYACTEASVEITSFSKRMAQNYELVETPIQDGIKYTVRRKSDSPSVKFT